MKIGPNKTSASSQISHLNKIPWSTDRWNSSRKIGINTHLLAAYTFFAEVSMVTQELRDGGNIK